MVAREKIGVIAVAALGSLLLFREIGNRAHTDDTFLRLVGHLENKNTGAFIPNATVTLVGAGLPPQARADSNGNIGASSSSSAKQIPVVITVAGYQPYSLVVAQRERVTICTYCMMPIFALTPIPPLPHARTARRLRLTEKKRGQAKYL